MVISAYPSPKGAFQFIRFYIVTSGRITINHISMVFRLSMFNAVFKSAKLSDCSLSVIFECQKKVSQASALQIRLYEPEWH
jgi:hypothetical protein